MFLQQPILFKLSFKHDVHLNVKLYFKWLFQFFEISSYLFCGAVQNLFVWILIKFDDCVIYTTVKNVGFNVSFLYISF